MDEPFTLHLDDIPVRFTPDGKVFIIDAIGATMHSNRAHDIWETLKAKHPDILAYCKDYQFQGTTFMPVVDSTGWEVIMALLFCDLADDDRERSMEESQVSC